MSKSNFIPERAQLLMDGWAGRQATDVEIVGETTTRYRVKDCTAIGIGALPGRRYSGPGDEFLVPKYAVRRNGPN